MKKITKSLLTLALLVLGVTSVNAKETVIGSIDYSADGAKVGWNALPDDNTASISISDGCLVFDNQSTSGNNWDVQCHILSGLTLESGLSYKVNITYKVETEQTNPTVTVALWADWSNSAPKYGTPITVSDDFTTMSLSFDDFGFNSGGGAIMWQCRSVLGKIYISKVEVIEIAPDAAPEDDPLYDTTIPDGFENLIINGDMEGSDFDNFRVNDYVDGVKQQVAAPRVITDPTDPSNQVIVITSNDNAANDYDAQLFITLPENQHFNLGDVVRLRMRVKAEAKGGAGSQFHNAPGDYIFYDGIGTINFKTVWTNFDSGEKEVTAARLNDNGKGPSRTIAFNLSVVGGVANTFYIDEVQLLVKRAPVIENWVNLLENAEPSETFFKTEQGLGGPWAIEDGDISILSADNPSTDWDTQFFVRLPKKLTEGTKYKVSFKYQASQAGGADTQAHYEPGGYKHWAFIGSPSFTTSEQTYENEGSISSDQNGIYTIAFNLAKNKKETTFYFSDFKFEVPEDTYATLVDAPSVPSYFTKPEPSVTMGAEYATMVPGYSMDISSSDLVAYSVTYVADVETPYIQLDEISELPWNKAVLVYAEGGAGTYSDGIEIKRSLGVETGLTAGWAQEGVEGQDNYKAPSKGDGSTIYVLADGSYGVGFYLLAADEIIPVGKGFLQIPAAEGRTFIGFAGDATTVKAIETLKKSGAIYNLAGQQVKNAQKGIFIIDGKKVIK